MEEVPWIRQYAFANVVLALGCRVFSEWALRSFRYCLVALVAVHVGMRCLFARVA